MNNSEPSNSDKPRGTQSFWSLLGNLLSFQFKLALDGIRDLVLSPVSFFATVIGIVLKPNDPGYYFRRLMHFGIKSDHWINLFNQNDEQAVPPRSNDSLDAQFEPSDSLRPRSNGNSSDDYIRKLESLVLNQYEKGGIVKNLKDSTDEIVRLIQDKHKKRNE